MVLQLDHLNLSVRNFVETATWYERIFGFKIVEQGTYNDRPWGVLKAGDAMLCVYEKPDHHLLQNKEREKQKQLGINHFALKIDNREAWEETLLREHLSFSYPSPVAWPHSTAWYILDPTGYEIEVALWHKGIPEFSTAKS